MYFGWADALISPRMGLDYYQRVSERMGGVERTQAFFRLFMVPGMTHCQGGPAPYAFGQAAIVPALRDDPDHDIRRALEAWVERGRAPDRIIAAKYVNDNPSQGVAMTATLHPWR
jgi:feruloyl esterase